MTNIAVITARGGSKRIPKKNIREFCGKPIIAYSIEAALQSGIFDEVMVSTDDEEIACVAKKYGAVVPFYRSEKTSGDYSTTRDVLKEVLSKYSENGCFFDYLCCIYPTAPFVTPDKIIKAYEMLKEEKTDKLEPIVAFENSPYDGFVINENGFLNNYQTKKNNIFNRKRLYHDVGQFYWYDVKKCFGTKEENFTISSIVLDNKEVQDIDNESDWIMAELKYSLLNNGEEIN